MQSNPRTPQFDLQLMLTEGETGASLLELNFPCSVNGMLTQGIYIFKGIFKEFFR